jgi:CIC family chloride channel protein
VSGTIERRGLGTTAREHAAARTLDLGRRLFPRGLRALRPDEDIHALLALAAVVGALGALAAAAFRAALAGGMVLFYGASEGLLEAAAGLPAWERLLLPFCGGGLCALIAHYVRRIPGGGGGVAGIMEAVAIKRGVVGLAAAAGRAVCSLATIASGGSVGREGPILQLASAVGSRVGRSLGLDEHRVRILVACGAAAGFAAAYHAPMAATLFVVEVLIGSAAAEVLGPAAVAAVVSTEVTRLVVGGAPLYAVAPFTLVSPLELVPYALLGIAAAAVGSIFLGGLAIGEWLFERLSPSRIVRGAAGGLVVGAIAIALPYVLGNGYDTTARLLGEPRLYGARFLVLILAAKLVATAATVGSGGPGGVFTPTLLIGAALGGALGDVVHWLAPARSAAPGAYALVGTGALLAATTHAPLLAVVFVFEGTQDYAMILPLMLACFVASAIGRRIRPQSIYAEELEKRGVAWEGGPEARALAALRVRDLVLPATLVAPDAPAAEIERALADPRADAVYVGDGAGGLLGAVDIHAARRFLRDVADLGAAVTARDMAVKVRTIPPDATAPDASEALLREDREELPCVDPSTGRFIGLVSRRRLLGAIDEEILRRKFFTEARAVPGARRYVELPATHRLEEVRVPDALAGRSLAEADLERRCGLTVLAVVARRSDGSEERKAARPDARLERGGLLVVYGAAEDVERFREDRP